VPNAGKSFLRRIASSLYHRGNSTIGVNAVAIKDVPENSIVIPSPMMLIREKGQNVYTKL